jgi:hypothetical protein
MSVELKSTLNGEQQSVDPTKAYLIDFSKMNSVNDLVMVLSSFGFTIGGDHPFIEQLKPFLNLQNPIDLPKQPKNDLEDRIFKGE